MRHADSCVAKRRKKRLRVYSKTDVGRIRTDNQDAYFAETLSNSAVFAIVCDGMGGANGGNIASKKAVEIIKNYIQKSFRNNFTEKDIIRLLQNAVLSANIELFRMSNEKEELRGMGTTVVLMLIINGRAYICHVGDSRAYLINDKVSVITRDHSIVQSLLESGKITPEEALTHPKRNIITRALGVEENVISDIDTVDINEGDFILLCTDGLSSLVTEEFIKETVTVSNAEDDLAQILVDKANENGGADNITAVIVFVDKMGE